MRGKFIGMPLVQVLALVVSLGLEEPRDVASFAATSRRCLAVCRLAPLRLAVRTPPAATAREEQAAARRMLQALIASWSGVFRRFSRTASRQGCALGSTDCQLVARLSTKACLSCLYVFGAGMAELDLRGSPLEDKDVLPAARMSALAALQLSGCKKLTPAGCSALLHSGRRLRSITLQRCFQLTASALSDVLGAAAAPGARLAAAALSHLSLASWPEHCAPLPGRLRVLALHNCAKLGPEVLAAIAASCPLLEVLLLGGCSLVVEEPAAGGGGTGGQTDDSSVDASSGGGGGATACAGGLDVAQFAEAARAAVRGCMPGGGVGGSYASYLARLAACLAAAVARLPALRVLELTFALPGLVPAMQHLFASEVGIDGCRMAADLMAFVTHVLLAMPVWLLVLLSAACNCTAPPDILRLPAPPAAGAAGRPFCARPGLGPVQPGLGERGGGVAAQRGSRQRQGG